MLGATPPLGDFTFYNVVLAVHIAAVVVGFGAAFAMPVLFGVAGRSDPRSLPTLHRVQRIVTGPLMSGGLVLVVLAGVYLASKSHAWGTFYVQWGIGVALVIGAVAGSFLAPRERRLIELSERDVAGAGSGSGAASGAPPAGSGAGSGAGSEAGPAATSVVLSAEYQQLARQVTIVTGAISGLALLTVLFMATHLGGS